MNWITQGAKFHRLFVSKDQNKWIFSLYKTKMEMRICVQISSKRKRWKPMVGVVAAIFTLETQVESEIMNMVLDISTRQTIPIDSVTTENIIIESQN